jgi:hypothetical protein
MADSKKQQYIQTSEYTLIGETGSPSADLAPGGRVAVNEDAESHKYLVAQIEAGNPAYSHLSLIEVDFADEEKRAEEEAEMAEKARQIAAEARNEEDQAVLEQQEKLAGAREEQAEAQSATAGTDFPPQDEESIRLAKESGAGQRATTDADVVEETGPKQGRRSSSSKK